MEQPTERPTEEPAEQPTEQPTEEPTTEPTEKPEENPAEQPTEEPAEQPEEKPEQERKTMSWNPKNRRGDFEESVNLKNSLPGKCRRKRAYANASVGGFSCCFMRKESAPSSIRGERQSYSRSAGCEWITYPGLFDAVTDVELSMTSRHQGKHHRQSVYGQPCLARIR
ncbi:MAG: hypothetical protein ACLUHE_02620 [Christensenellales bacterium]